jgi:hypothetical protein
MLYRVDKNKCHNFKHELYLFTALGTAIKLTTLLSPPLKVLFLLFSHSPTNTRMLRRGIYREDELEDYSQFLAT